MSGSPGVTRSYSTDEQREIVANVRRLSETKPEQGPDDQHILSAVIGFVEQFNYWYSRVMENAVVQYRNLVIKRINPFVRRIQCEGRSPLEMAFILIEDYNARNFVTAGGWALEAMAIRLGHDNQKSASTGLDIQRIDPKTGDYHLYILKSGLVTRNSDILSSLKKHVRAAEKLLRQDRFKGQVVGNYAILAGKTQGSFEDGIRRPSSGEFWEEITSLPAPKCIALALAVAAEAGRLVRRDSDPHIKALKRVVADYIADRGDPAKVDWEFISRRNMQQDAAWKGEDKVRHKRAMEALAASGYTIVKPEAKKAKKKMKPARNPEDDPPLKEVKSP